MFVLDTNVISELMRPEPDTVVIVWVELQKTSDLFTTTIGEPELRYGIEILQRHRHSSSRPVDISSAPDPTHTGCTSNPTNSNDDSQPTCTVISREPPPHHAT